MEYKKQIKSAIIFLIILLTFILIYIVFSKLFNQDKLDYNNYLKDYEVNEYIPVYISDEDMARIYLNDYIHTIYSNIEKAYNFLDEEYRTKRFNNIVDYQNYITTLNFSSYKVERYYVKENDEYKIFGVYDSNNNLYIFKTNGVMQYTVYLDDYTVEI